MAGESAQRGGITVGAEYRDRFNKLLGESRTATGAFKAVIAWLERQSPSIRSVLFDGDLTPEAEAAVLTTIADEAMTRAGKRVPLGQFIRKRMPMAGFATANELRIRAGVKVDALDHALAASGDADVGDKFEHGEAIARALLFPTWDALTTAWRRNDTQAGIPFHIMNANIEQLRMRSRSTADAKIVALIERAHAAKSQQAKVAVFDELVAALEDVAGGAGGQAGTAA